MKKNLIFLFTLLLISGCNSKDNVINENDKLSFNENEHSALPYSGMVIFICTNSSSWHVSSISEIIGDEIQKQSSDNWYEIKKTGSTLEVSYKENMTGEERSLIIQIKSDSQFKDDSLKFTQNSYPEFNEESTSAKRNLTEHLWAPYALTPEGWATGTPLQFLENGMIRIYHGHPDLETNYEDIAEYKITADYFFKEDFFGNFTFEDENDVSYYFLRRRIYSYKFQDDKFEISIKYGVIQGESKYTYIRIK
ncbi:MAG: hypothetical protein LBV74_10060 [Tannerella sp.]|jgi:hypothetical protein|nr:hypothetical protein [Tannerella sp.]